MFFTWLFTTISNLFLVNKPEDGKDKTILAQLGEWLDKIIPIPFG